MMIVICWFVDCQFVKKFLWLGVVSLVRQIEMLFSLVFVEKFCSSWLISMSMGVSSLIVVQFGMNVIRMVLFVMMDSVMIRFLWWLILLMYVFSMIVFSGCIRKLVLNMVKVIINDVNLFCVGKKMLVICVVQKLNRKKLNCLRKLLVVM